MTPLPGGPERKAIAAIGHLEGAETAVHDPFMGNGMLFTRWR
jgi:hypothetical protein